MPSRAGRWVIKWNLPGPRMTTCTVVEKVYELMNSEELSEHFMVPRPGSWQSCHFGRSGFAVLFG